MTPFPLAGLQQRGEVHLPGGVDGEGLQRLRPHPRAEADGGDGAIQGSVCPRGTPCCPQATQAGLSRFVPSPAGAPECPPPPTLVPQLSWAWLGFPSLPRLWVIPGAVPVSPHPVPTEVYSRGWVCLPPRSPQHWDCPGAVSWCPPVPSPLTCSLWLGLSPPRLPRYWGIPGAASPCPHVPFPLTCDPVPSSVSRLSQVPVAPISLSAPSRGPCWWLPSS